MLFVIGGLAVKCSSCHQDSPASECLIHNDTIITYYVCVPCAQLWIPGEIAEELKLDHPKEKHGISEQFCHVCDNVFLEDVVVRPDFPLKTIQCRKCLGVKVYCDDSLLQHRLPLSDPFGEFLTKVGLFRRQELAIQKKTQFPASFRVKDARETDFRCPACSKALTLYNVQCANVMSKADFEICDGCFGIWLDSDDMHAKPGGKSLEVDYESIAPGGRTCAKCREINMITMKFRDIDVEIDVCPSCFGTWLDGGELKAFCNHMGKDDYDVIDALTDNAIFAQPVLCKMLRQFSETLYNLDSQVQKQEQNLEQAREIQARLIYKAGEDEGLTEFEHYQIATFWQPARTVGGDFFDLIPFEVDGIPYLGVCVADVSGKGMAAALLMANFQALLRAFAPSNLSSGKVCAQLNDVLFHNTANNKYITAFYGILNLKSHSFTYTNAGHNLPIHVAGEKVDHLKTGGTVLGLFPTWTYEEKICDLAPGDRILFYTDGLSEVENPDGEDFGDERLTDLVASFKADPLSHAHHKVIRAVKEFCLGHFQDDATSLFLERKV